MDEGLGAYQALASGPSWLTTQVELGNPLNYNASLKIESLTLLTGELGCP